MIFTLVRMSCIISVFLSKTGSFRDTFEVCDSQCDVYCLFMKMPSHVAEND
jgi:hypothetical protein